MPRLVLISSDKSVGTGCFIAPGAILTCAHVVRDAKKAGLPVNIQFPSKGSDGKSINKVLAVTEIILSDLTDGAEYPDVAILKINDEQHPILKLPGAEEGVDYSSNQEYLAIGFQKQDPQTGKNYPQTVSLNYEGEQDAGNLRKIIFENGLIRPGMSGAPLVERRTGRITGLVQMTRDPNTNLGAFTIPAEVVLKEIEKLSPELMASLQSRSLRFRINKEYRQAYPLYPILQKFGVRLLLLFILLFFGVWWMLYHFGQSQRSIVMAALLVAFGFFGNFLGSGLGKDAATETAEVKSKVNRWLIHPAILVILFLGITACWFCVTSVWVYGSPDNGKLAITLTRNEGDKAGIIKELNQDHRLRFLIPFLPFQDTIFLHPEGREMKAIPIHSFFRTEYNYPADFPIEPVLFLRVDPNYLFQKILTHYQLHLKILPTGLDTTYTDLKDVNSIVIGKRNPDISQDTKTGWQKDLVGLPPEEINKIVEAWKTYEHLPGTNLDVDTKVEITLIEKPGAKIISQKIYDIQDDWTDELLLFEIINH